MRKIVYAKDKTFTGQENPEMFQLDLLWDVFLTHKRHNLLQLSTMSGWLPCGHSYHCCIYFLWDPCRNNSVIPGGLHHPDSSHFCFFFFSPGPPCFTTWRQWQPPLCCWLTSTYNWSPTVLFFFLFVCLFSSSTFLICCSAFLAHSVSFTDFHMWNFICLFLAGNIWYVSDVQA